jgi:lysophospholipase L1-like esterase
VRSALKIAIVVFYNIAFICGVFGVAEYVARRVTGSPVNQIELQLDRWTAFRNNPRYRDNNVQLNEAGFRRDSNILPQKPSNTIRIFLLGGSVAYGAETLYPEIDGRWRINNHQTVDYDLEQRLNAAYPANHWEVINAAVKGYLLNQDLSLYLSAVQRYHPDYLVLLDGVNDLYGLLRLPDTNDDYNRAGLGAEFDGLTSPASMSLRFASSTWLFDRSSLYRLIRGSVSRRHQLRARKERIREAEAHPHRGLAGMTQDEQRRYRLAAAELGGYLRPVRQIHRIAAVEGTRTLFALQPHIATTRKALTSSESKLREYWSKLDGSLYVYGFQTLYPRLPGELSDGARAEGYQFADLTGVFDHMSVQAFTDYCHLTPAGNQAIADALFTSLAASLPRGAGEQGP